LTERVLHVEQAVFTSAVTRRMAGYQVVGQSPGVSPADARELAVWCPSHDSLAATSLEVVSFNFHPLADDRFCVSRTTPAGWEYSGRGGHRVYTQCLIVSAEGLANWGNNPFALIQAANAAEVWQVHEQVPKRLPTLSLCGSRGATCDHALLARLAEQPGSAAMAALVQSALESRCLALFGPRPNEELIAGVISCLPVECRPEFSFTTGLKYSSRRPFRVVGLWDDPAERRWVSHQANTTVLDLSDVAAVEAMNCEGWAALIRRVLTLGQSDFLNVQFSKRRFDLAAADLSGLALQLLEDLEAGRLRSEPEDAESTESSDPTIRNDAPADISRELCQPTHARETPAANEHRNQAHAAHRQFAKCIAEKRPAGPATTLHPGSPEVLEALEHLDDVVYDAINGRADHLEELKTLWPTTVAALGEELVAESREQYLRYALAAWEEGNDRDGLRQPARAAHALDVLCILFDDA